jgi:uncharacterized RDD family membrane protein YckC
MAVVQTRQRSSPWGWSILMVLCAFLVINGIWLFFSVGSPVVFEGDTGVSLSELQAAYPTVAAVMERRGQNISVLLMGLGVLAFVVAFAGLKMGSVWAWNALWALVLALAAIAALTLTEGRADLGIYYLLLALIAASAQLLARKGLRG